MTTILLVDDEPEILETLKYSLELEGFRTFTATNFNEASAILFNERIDTLVADLRLPGGSGLDLIRQSIRSGCRPLKCVIMTGANELRSCMAEKHLVDEVFPKPFKLVDFIFFLRKVRTDTSAI